ncbi:hypothetical protein KP509_13G023500 [Ceratopteris richardii]|uniref:CHCH domain-containing protein n=1 Tax=Ceratopteris richardii TaxID=49495 RepID=A0A8T2TG48_CERRI|nr:hypothetical protein KP509_13G023500 [Ceratopteris richardii]
MEHADEGSRSSNIPPIEKVDEGESSDLEDLELKAEQALSCPCVADLREGPCGKEFSEAFVCFIKSTAEHKVFL